MVTIVIGTKLKDFRTKLRMMVFYFIFFILIIAWRMIEDLFSTRGYIWGELTANHLTWRSSVALAFSGLLELHFMDIFAFCKRNKQRLTNSLEAFTTSGSTLAEIEVTGNPVLEQQETIEL